MKQFKTISAVLALLISGQVFALEQDSKGYCEEIKKSRQDAEVHYQVIDNTAATSLTEIVLQHEFVEQFKHLDEPRFFPLKMTVRNDAQHLTDPGIVATIRARDSQEGLLVAGTYQREGATIQFDIIPVPDTEVVTITFDRRTCDQILKSEGQMQMWQAKATKD